MSLQSSPTRETSAEPVVLKQTDRWVVVSKPAGWLSVRPSETEVRPRPILVDWVRENHGETFAVHRLDLETSGAILFARNAEAHREANTWFQKHLVKKTYH